MSLGDHACHEILNDGTNWAFNLVCASGCLHMIEWLFKHGNLTVDDLKKDNNYALVIVCNNKHYDILEWFIAHFPLEIDDFEMFLNYEDKSVIGKS